MSELAVRVFSEAEYRELQGAVRKLETQSLAMKVAERVGMPVEGLLHMLPAKTQVAIGAAVNKALEQCFQVALNVGPKAGGRQNTQHNRAHTAAVAVSGAVGGFFGLPGLLVELPITTTVMLHSIVEIARSQGENLADPESALACLEVFALGPDHRHREAMESAYYVSRTGLAQATREASAYLLRKGMAREGAPALVSFLGKIASRFGLEVSEKVAAEIVPIAGAFGGMTLNILFSRHFQSLAEGHFVVRRLERKYGAEVVRLNYERARLMLPA